MKRKTITVLSFFLLSATIIKDKSHYKHKSSSKNNAFCVGEKLTYRVSYGIIDAGEVTLEVALWGCLEDMPRYREIRVS